MNAEPARWTIDRLARLTAAALAAGIPAPQPNGRIREVPDVRTIRYYTSIGLLDRPAAMRGRTALYGRRHLAQLVAIKRLQAAGLALTEVQRQLLGADASAIEDIAQLPTDAELDTLEALADIADVADAAEIAELEALPANNDAPSPTRRERFWSARPASTVLDSALPLDRAEPSQAANANAATGTAPDTGTGSESQTSLRSTPDTSSPDASTTPAPTHTTIPPLHPAIRLSPTITLLLSPNATRLPNAADRAAIADAAQPLLDLLHRLGLSES